MESVPVIIARYCSRWYPQGCHIDASFSLAWIQVKDDQDPVRFLGRMQMIMAEDGRLKTMALKRVHEKKWEKRKRKL
ncbi:hypothetical protein PsorP6_009579 [Peronosclerospora sorghi]|uniref:Uncharacterized protein n=1 Tax=Peronosclerospora sorghi TaxID=230839 RepID=A0ACC0W1W5_9STRA|nr:hypothetical protein PsorP6_009579 [Peronosclerospora sorghi]